MGAELPHWAKLLLGLAAFVGFLWNYRAIGTRHLRQRALAVMLAAQQPATDAGTVSEDELAHLPEPVQRWLRWAGVSGQPRLGSVKLAQRGRFRLGRDKPWMPFTAEQVYTLNPPQFAWFVRMSISGLPLSGWDWYVEGSGNLRMELAGLITVADAQSPELNEGELLRWLSEIIWFPQAALAPCVSWEALGDHSARATVTHAGLSLSGEFSFDTDGRPISFTAMRYLGFGSQPSRERWVTPSTAWAEYQPGPGWPAVRIPSTGYVEWQLADGPLRYADVEITTLAYNPPPA